MKYKVSEVRELRNLATAITNFCVVKYGDEYSFRYSTGLGYYLKNKHYIHQNDRIYDI